MKRDLFVIYFVDREGSRQQHSICYEHELTRFVATAAGKAVELGVAISVERRRPAA